MNKYKIVVKYGMLSENEYQEDSKDLITIKNILAHDKCVIIGKTLYTFDNIITIEQI